MNPLRALGWLVLPQIIRRKFPQVQQLSTAALADWLAQRDRPSPLLLDTRTPEEYAVSHLPNAQRLDPQTTDFSQLSEIERDRPIVTYCSVGYRSSAIATRLQEAGFRHVANLEGSIFRWANEGRPVVREEQPVQQVHPYNAQWGLLLQSQLHTYTPN